MRLPFYVSLSLSLSLSHSFSLYCFVLHFFVSLSRMIHSHRHTLSFSRPLFSVSIHALIRHFSLSILRVSLSLSLSLSVCLLACLLISFARLSGRLFEMISIKCDRSTRDFNFSGSRAGPSRVKGRVYFGERDRLEFARVTRASFEK